MIPNFIRRTRAVWKPPKFISGSAWAGKHRVLSPEASAMSGRWRNERTPYGREILDAATDPMVHKIVMMMGAQVFKSEGMLNIIGQDIHMAPGPMMFLFPDDDTSDKLSRRFDLMVRDTPVLDRLIGPRKARKARYTIHHKEFPGGAIDFGSANSPTFMSSSPIRYLIGDEIDRYCTSSRTEGDPLTIASARLITYHNARTIIGSTPLIKSTSAIEREYNESDMRQFHVPCLKCGSMQVLMWSGVKFKIVDDPNPLSTKRLAKDIYYQCKTCDHHILQSEKAKMLSEGQWIAQAEFHGIAGFWLNGLNSPFMTWEDVANKFLKADRGGQLALQAFWNTIMAEVWEEQGEKIEAGALLSRRESYTIRTDTGHVPTDRPEGVEMITMGVDTGIDNIRYQVWGWGRDWERWLLDYELFSGDPKLSIIWTKLGGVLAKRFRGMHVSALFADSGYNTKEVYRFSREYAGAWAVKGDTGNPTWIVNKSQTKADGRGVLYMANVNSLKRDFYNSIQVQEPGPRYCHFSMACDQALFDGIASEVLRDRPKHGYHNFVWELLPGHENHWLDTAIYAQAAAHHIAGRDMNAHLDALVADQKQQQEAVASPKPSGDWLAGVVDNWS